MTPIPKSPQTTVNITSIPSPPPAPTHPEPLLRLEFCDLSDSGTHLFLGHATLATLLSSAVSNVLTHLYPFSSHWPGTRSITLIIESFSGVAFTTGKSIDEDHKEIHFSTSYITSLRQKPRHIVADEIRGVVVHEMVHCWQHNAQGTAPGGLIEGVADWVRLKAGLVPPHWKREADGDWDAGYQHTGYFLDYLEGRFGDGTVARINETMRGGKYEEERFWDGLFATKVEKLWKEYGEWLEPERGGDGKKGKERDGKKEEGGAEKKEKVGIEDKEKGSDEPKEKRDDEKKEASHDGKKGTGDDAKTERERDGEKNTEDDGEKKKEDDRKRKKEDDRKRKKEDDRKRKKEDDVQTETSKVEADSPSEVLQTVV